MNIVLKNGTRDPFTMLSRNLFGWDPFAELRPMARAATMAPAFDVKETADRYLITADLPGIAKEDLDITLDGNRLTVSGSRAAETETEGETHHIVERRFGTFTRTFTLPEEANAEAIEADLKNGVLSLSIPKQPEAKPKKISLK